MTARNLVLVLALVATASAANTIVFVPPNPTSATPVVAHVAAPQYVCAVAANVARNGNVITIALQSGHCPGVPSSLPVDFPVSLGMVPAGVYDVVATSGSVVAEGTLVVRDAAPPFQVVPNVLPAVNGGQVHLRGDGFDVAVTLPPHAPGVVDVSLDRNGAHMNAVAALDYYEFEKQPEPAFFEPVIFPAIVSGTGAFGSRWTTAVSMRNDDDLPLSSPSSFFNVVCCPICETRPPAHGDVIVTGANVPAGFVYFVPRQSAPRLFFDILARDLSRQSEALGTEIPVVREKDLYDRRIHILDVPAEAKYRVALRILSVAGSPSARVLIYAMADGRGLVDATIPLLSPSAATTYASGGVLDLVQFFPALAGKGPLRIEVDSASTLPATWAFVSVTNNETQHVTVIAPH